MLKGQQREAGGVSEPKTLMAVLFPFKLSRQQRPFQLQAWAGLRVPASGRTHSPSYPQESGESPSFRCGPRTFTRPWRRTWHLAVMATVCGGLASTRLAGALHMSCEDFGPRFTALPGPRAHTWRGEPDSACAPGCVASKPCLSPGLHCCKKYCQPVSPPGFGGEGMS